MVVLVFWCSRAGQERIIIELLRAGAPVHMRFAPRVLPLAVRLMQQQQYKLEWLESGKHWDWEGHDEVVGLVFDLRHAQEEERPVAGLQAKVARRERLLAAIEELEALPRRIEALELELQQEREGGGSG